MAHRSPPAARPQIRLAREVLVPGLALLLLLAGVARAFAFPPLPSSLYGTVKVDGANVSADTRVSAWIRGVKYAESAVSTYAGNSTYGLNVPGDDPTTPGVEGGVSGDTIVIRIGELVADQVGTWHSGTNVQLNLTATSCGGPRADTNYDGVVDAADIAAVAQRWRAALGDPGYDGWLDMTGDGRIDVADTAFVASAWGGRCP